MSEAFQLVEGLLQFIQPVIECKDSVLSLHLSVPFWCLLFATFGGVIYLELVFYKFVRYSTHPFSYQYFLSSLRSQHLHDSYDLALPATLAV